MNEVKCSMCRGLGAREERVPGGPDGLMVSACPVIVRCPACNGSGSAPEPDVLAAVEQRLAEAHRRMEAELLRSMFPVYEGPAEKPDSPWRRTSWGIRLRVRAWWYRVREWIAVHVLRVQVAEEDW